MPHSGTAGAADSVISVNAACTSNLVWHAWNVTYSDVVSMSCTASNEIIWLAWNQVYRTDVITATGGIIQINPANAIWTNWNGQLTAREREAAHQAAHGRQASQEQRDQWRREENERRARQEREDRERAAAKEKAEVLLLQHLSPEQREELRANGFFHVDVDGVRYQIRRGSHGNVHMLGDGDQRVKKTFCIQPREVPEGDAMLAQKLMLEADPEEFWKKANITHHDGQSVPKRDNVLEFRRTHRRPAA